MNIHSDEFFWCVNRSFHYLQQISKSTSAELYNKCIFSSMRNCPTFFQSGYISRGSDFKTTLFLVLWPERLKLFLLLLLLFCLFCYVFLCSLEFLNCGLFQHPSQNVCIFLLALFTGHP